MRQIATLEAGAAVLILCCFGLRALAQPTDAPDAAPPGVDAGASLPSASPPSLKSHVQAQYPADALAERREGSVGLELDIDTTGLVTDVRVSSSAGPTFDAAAIEAARQFSFEPARQAGQPVAARVQFTYEFHLPPSAGPEPPPAAAATPPLTAATPPTDHTQTGADQSTLVLANRPISAASSFSVRDRDFALRPIGSVQDILRVTPGLLLLQHSGGGKANQYFLRGFDADHGTDLALSIDGIPINMVSHAHGQGFSDTNFIIPEVVERVEVTKGPYFANQGDFATAGAVNMVSRDQFEHSSVGFGFGGSPGHGAPSYRGIVIASPKFDDAIKTTFAAEVGRSNGPFDNPENWDKLKLFNKLTYAINAASSLSVGEMSYASNWHGSGQIPARAVDQHIIPRYGSVDSDEGGNTARHQVYVQYRLRPNEHSDIKALLYLGSYRFNLFSNFTLFLADPDNGDEIEQVDRRAFYGAKLSYRMVRELGGVRFDSQLGADIRSDDIHAELWHTAERSHLDNLRNNDVHETLGGVYINEEIAPTRWLRVNLGGRADIMAFAVDNRLPDDPSGPRSGADGAQQLSPKASLILSPLQYPDEQLDVYVNYGHGFHSNDVRGAFTDPSVTPLARARGAEVGSRARLWSRWDLAVAFWQLDLATETVWSGDEGTTQVSGATTRRGVEIETRYELTSWLAADMDLTFTKSALKENRGNGRGLALAPKQTWAGGLSARHALGPGIARGGLRFYGIGDRPASDDGVIVAEGFTQVDLHLGYRHDRFDVAFDIENLLNGAFRSAQFDTVSRLRTEPAVGAALPGGFTCGRNARLASAPDAGAAGGGFYGCEDVNFIPAYPFSARVTATVFLD